MASGPNGDFTTTLDLGQPGLPSNCFPTLNFLINEAFLFQPFGSPALFCGLGQGNITITFTV
jgi:hypothetical protein